MYILLRIVSTYIYLSGYNTKTRKSGSLRESKRVSIFRYVRNRCQALSNIFKCTDLVLHSFNIPIAAQEHRTNCYTCIIPFSW